MKASVLVHLTVLGFLLGLGTQDAWAESKKWVGKGKTPVWSDDANWESAGVPTSGDSVQVSFATVTLDVAAEAGDLELGGSLIGPGSLTVNGKFTWTGGELAGSGIAELKGETTILGSVGFHREIHNSGRLTWSGGDLDLAAGLRFENNGTWNIACDRTTSFGASDRRFVFENKGGGTIAKTSGTGRATLFPILINRGTVSAGSGTLVLSGVSTNFATYTAQGGTLELTGTHIVWADATLTGSGTVAISGGTTTLYGPMRVSGQTRVTGATLDAQWSGSTESLYLGSNGKITGPFDFTVNGFFTWEAAASVGSDLAGTGRLLAQGGMEITGPGIKSLTGRRLISAGNIVWSDGRISLDRGAWFQNDGSIAIEGSFPTMYGSTAPLSVLVNNGAIIHSAPAGDCIIMATVQNNGAISASSALRTLKLSGGSTNTGSFEAMGNATLEFGGGNHYCLPSSTVSGAGTIGVSSGFVSFGGPYQAHWTCISGQGQAEFIPGDCTTDGLSLTGNGELTGPGTMTVNDTLGWNPSRGVASLMTGTGQVIVNGTAYLDGEGEKHLSGRVLQLKNFTAWLAGPFYGYQGARLINSGSYAIFATNVMGVTPGGGTVAGTPGFFVNQGSIGKTTSDRADLGWNLANNSQVEVKAGELRLTGSSTNTGPFSVSAGATLTFAGANHRLLGSVDGGGTVRVFSGQTSFGGPYHVSSRTEIVNLGTAEFTPQDCTTDSLLLSGGGELTGTGTLTVRGKLAWSAGSGGANAMTAAGLTVVEGDAEIGGAGDKHLSGRTLVLKGTTKWSGGPFYGYRGARLVNYGTYRIETPSSMSWNPGMGSVEPKGVFDNRGVAVKADTGAANDVADLGWRLTNSVTLTVEKGTLRLTLDGANDGLIDVQAAGSLVFFGGLYTLTTNSILGGDGLVVFRTGGPYEIGGMVQLANAKVDAGDVHFQSPDGTIQNLTMASGTLGGAGLLTVTKSFLWDAPRYVESTIDGSGTLRVTGTTEIKSVQDRTVSGRRFETIGDTTWNDSEVYLQSGALWQNEGTLTINKDVSLDTWTGGGTLLNKGKIVKPPGSAQGTTIWPTFDNEGTVEVQSQARLNVITGACTNGTFNVAGSLVFKGAYTLYGTAQGAGTVTFPEGCSVSIGSNYQVAGTNALDGGTLLCNNGPAKPGVFVFKSGTLKGAGTGALAVQSSTIFGTSSDKKLDGATLQLNGAAEWRDGDIYAANGTLIDNAGTFKLCPTNSYLTYCLWAGTSPPSRLLNRGTVQVQASGRIFKIVVPLENSNAAYVYAGQGTLSLLAGGTTSGRMECGANGTITLGGAFTFDTASDTSGSGSYQIVGTVAVDGAWNVKGSAEVLGGTLTLNSDAQCGTLSIFDKGTLAGAGNVTVTELLDWRDARIQGSGTLISLANATIGFGGAEVILESRTLCLNGSTRWTEGKIRLQGGAVIQNKGVFTIPATADSMLAGPGGGTFSNSGSVTRNNSGALWPGATTIAPKLENSGIVEVDAGVLTFTGGGGGNGKYRVLKGATLEFSGLPYNLSGASYEGDGNVLFKINTAIGPGFLPTGGLQVGSGNVSLGLNPGDTYTFPGALQVDQGAQFSVNGGNLLNQGCLSGSGTFCLNDAHLCDQGATAPGNSPGILTILGPYVQGPGGRLQIEIAGTAAGTQYDQLKVTGPVTLSGQLQVALLNNYVPKAGDKFSILTATSLSGVFAHTTAPRFANNLTLVPYYGAGGVTLVFTNAPVVPVSLSPSLSGSELGLAWSGEYVLETTRDLKPPVQWQPVTNVVGQGTQRQFKADTQTAPSAYYRLRQD